MNDLVDIEITDIGIAGDGIGECEAGAVYVPHTMAGDSVRVRLGKKGRYGYKGDVVELLTPADNRKDPACQHFGQCGGCQLQHLSNDDYAEWMHKTVLETMQYHGHTDPVVNAPILSDQQTRRRVNLKFLKTKNDLILGFNKRGSHQMIDVKSCPVTHVLLTGLFDPIRTILFKIAKDRLAGEVHLTLTATGVDMLIDAPMVLSLEQRESLVDFANQHDISVLNWQEQGFLDPVIHRKQTFMDFAGAKVPLPPAAFIQATEDGEAAMVRLVLEATKEAKRVADLFSGIGTFTFPLAKTAQTLAVEGFKPALDALQAGVNASQGFKQIIAKHRDLYRRPLIPKELSQFDAVVFDPPRAGAKDQAHMLAESDINTVVAVSCSPNSFARDGKILIDGGYTLESVTPIGQFRWTPHVELVGVFRK